MTGSIGDNHGIEAGVDVQVAVGTVGGGGHEPADSPAVARSDPGDIEHQPAGEPRRERRHQRIGRGGHLGQQGECVVGVLFDEIGQCLLVDLADFGRDVAERRIAAQLLTGCGPTVLVGKRLLDIVPLEGERRARVAP